MKLRCAISIVLLVTGVATWTIYGTASRNLTHLGADEVWHFPQDMTELRSEYPFLWLAMKLSGVDPYGTKEAPRATPGSNRWRNSLEHYCRAGQWATAAGILLGLIDWRIRLKRK